MIGPDKLYLLETRLGPILRREGMRDLAALAVRLGGPGTENLAQDVVEAMTTNESLFFRDSKPFGHIRTHVLPRVIAARPGGSALRIWSAAAPTLARRWHGHARDFIHSSRCSAACLC